MPTVKQSLLRWILVIASVLLVIGLVTPMLTITKFIFIEDSFSIVSGVGQLFTERHFVLFIAISIFSIILPIAKIALLFNLLHPSERQPQRRKKLLHLMHDYGRWAMLDVMVVAVLVVTVKLGAIASIQIHSGLYIFGSAVLLIMFITQQVVQLHNTDTNN